MPAKAGVGIAVDFAGVIDVQADANAGWINGECAAIGDNVEGLLGGPKVARGQAIAASVGCALGVACVFQARAAQFIGARVGGAIFTKSAEEFRVVIAVANAIAAGAINVVQAGIGIAIKGFGVVVGSNCDGCQEAAQQGAIVALIKAPYRTATTGVIDTRAPAGEVDYVAELRGG